MTTTLPIPQQVEQQPKHKVSHKLNHRARIQGIIQVKPRAMDKIKAKISRSQLQEEAQSNLYHLTLMSQ